MNNNIKLSVTITGIPGSKRKLVGYKSLRWIITKQDVSKTKLPPKVGKTILRKGTTKLPIYEYEPCSMKINMTEDAYNYMTSQEIPYWYKKKDWRKLSRTQRLEMHLDRVRQQYHGTSLAYTVFED